MLIQEIITFIIIACAIFIAFNKIQKALVVKKSKCLDCIDKGCHKN
jgi:large-conductance mechanosensitive channel